ncbi:Uncharacterised protein [Citrobacter freundii]|nr:Uncharacterised protein [Citrobacter freundii]
MQIIYFDYTQILESTPALAGSGIFTVPLMNW